MKLGKKYIIAIAICAFVAVAAAVAIPIIVKNAKRPKPEIKNEMATIKILNDTFELNSNDKRTTLSLESLHKDTEIVVEYESGSAKISIDGEVLEKGAQKNLGTQEISRDNTIEILVEFENGVKKTYLLNSLNEYFPNYKTEGQSAFDGYLYSATYSYNPSDPRFIFILDRNGNLVYYKRTKRIAFDFKKIELEDGSVRYTYLESSGQKVKGTIITWVYCNLVVLNENFEEINRIGYKTSDEVLDIENHTYLYFADNHYIVTAYTFETDSNGNMIENCHIQEIENGQIKWQFESKDYPQFVENCSLGGTNFKNNYQDYMHINSFAFDPQDNNLVCSLRNQDALIKIDRTSGQLVWTLGGKGDEFGLLDEQKFSKQHSAIFKEDGTIMLFDNGNQNERTRIVTLKIDQQTKTVVSFEKFDLGLYSSSMGSVRIISEANNIYGVCYGSLPSGIDHFAYEEINFDSGEYGFKFQFVDLGLTTKMLYNLNLCK